MTNQDRGDIDTLNRWIYQIETSREKLYPEFLFLQQKLKDLLWFIENHVDTSPNYEGMGIWHFVQDVKENEYLRKFNHHSNKEMEQKLNYTKLINARNKILIELKELKTALTKDKFVFKKLL